MGDKDEAKRTMRAAGVPVIPGGGIIPSVAEAFAEGDAIGYPLLVKARSGGGGRGIRKVEKKEDLERAFLAATAEAESAFGDGAVYMEKFLAPSKHIEMQLLCDNYGGVVCLGERECSMQRKKQNGQKRSAAVCRAPLLLFGLFWCRRPEPSGGKQEKER